MSEYNEELLNDVDDFNDLGEADEDALLQEDEDGDVLDIVPEELLDDSHVNVSELDEDNEEAQRKDKFAVEREHTTAPEKAVTIQGVEKSTPRNNNRFQRPGPRGYQRGRGGNNTRGRPQNNARGRFSYGNQTGRNKTVLINPRFQGVVHVNNNARLAWDSPPQQQYPTNPWITGVPPGSLHPAQGNTMHQMQPGPPIQQPPMQSFQHQFPMNQNYQGQPMPPMHVEQPLQQGHLMGQNSQYIPPQQQPFMPQPLPPGVQQTPHQIPIQQNNTPYLHNNYQSPPPMMLNTNQPPPPQYFAPDYNDNMFNQQGNLFPGQQQNVYQRSNFTPNRPPLFSNNNLLKRELFTQKRKVMGSPVTPRKKLIHERLGNSPKPQTGIKHFSVKNEDRPSVVKTIPVVTTIKIEEDADTRDLRLKILEQKRKREAILEWKEKRRLMKIGTIQNSEIEVEENSFKSELNSIPSIKSENNKQIRQIKVKTQSNNIVITNGYSRKTTRYQKGPKETNRVVLAVPTVQSVPPETDLKLDKEHLSSFLADRKIIPKDESLMSTRKVLIKNISTSTGDKKILQISKTMGEVQKLHRDKNERQATIIFKNVASAHAFFKKYRRHMLDLSMIEVSLSPMTESDE